MRDYDPTLGRYLQADPLGLVDGASVYSYARQNPGRYVDPRGEQTITLGGGSSGGLFGGGLGTGTSSSNIDFGDAWEELLDLSHHYNPIDLLLQEIVRMCTPSEEDRCTIIYRKCRQNCIDYFVEGPFPGHSGPDQAAGMRSCIRECMRAHGCSY